MKRLDVLALGLFAIAACGDNANAPAPNETPAFDVQSAQMLSLEIATRNGDLIDLSVPLDLKSMTFCSIEPDVSSVGLFGIDEAGISITLDVPQSPQLTNGCGTFTAPFSSRIREPIAETFDAFPVGEYIVSFGEGAPDYGTLDAAVFDLTDPTLQGNGAFELDVVTRGGITIHLSAATNLQTLTFCGITSEVFRLSLHRLNPEHFGIVFEVPQLPQVTGGCASFTAPFTAKVALQVFDAFPLGRYLLELRNAQSQSIDGSTFFLSAALVGDGVLKAEVEALVDQGVLRRGQARALLATLDVAARHIWEGNNGAARAVLQAFVSQVEAFVRAGSLSAEQGQELIDSANAVIGQLGQSA